MQHEVGHFKLNILKPDGWTDKRHRHNNLTLALSFDSEKLIFGCDVWTPQMCWVLPQSSITAAGGESASRSRTLMCFHIEALQCDGWLDQREMKRWRLITLTWGTMVNKSALQFTYSYHFTLEYFAKLLLKLWKTKSTVFHDQVASEVPLRLHTTQTLCTSIVIILIPPCIQLFP